MKNKEVGLGIVLNFPDPGVWLKFVSMSSAISLYFREEHPDLWSDRQIGVAMEIQKSEGHKIDLSFTMENSLEAVTVDCLINLSSSVSKFTVISTNHRLPPDKAVVKHRAVLEGGRLHKLGIA